tara:strand:- start:105 stop:374 length:270 start_codon:yes stop_codon:yes gene_type:complete
MSLTKNEVIEIGRIQSPYFFIHVINKTIIQEDGIEISSQTKEHVCRPDSDISGQDSVVQKIANLLWTDEVKANYQSFLEEQNAEVNPAE